MGATRTAAAARRRHVVDEAARLFRERGVDGIGVADLMKAAGLTHGGFYRQFASRDALVAEAVARAFESVAAEAPPPGADASAIAARIARYLGREHRDAVGQGCAVPALAADAGRAGAAAQRAFVAGVEQMIDAIGGDWRASGVPAAEARGRAIATIAAMSGAIALARAVSTEAPALSDEVLEAVLTSLRPAVRAPSG